MSLELLAPVGSPASLRAAVESGADSVYFGGMWNARLRARNFSDKELPAAIAYCHKNNVKAYITLNTLVYEGEIPLLAKYIESLYEYGADALILQDFAIAEIAKQVAPGLSLHASTQMSTHNSKTASILKKLGFDRVVLARELSLEQVKRIKQESGIETEVFAHGALCYSYSGRCLFSFVQTGRSGNRGSCAQMCRFPWKLFCDGKEMNKGYLTSTKDLHTIDHIPQIAESGVNCIKIEGRLKDAVYIQKVVSAYRKAIDTGQATNLSKLTSRGYTGGYLFGEAKEHKLINPESSSFSGTKLGKVISCDKNGAKIDIYTSIKVGDSIRSSSGGKIIEIFRIYQKGKEVQQATKQCEIKIKTLRKGDNLFKIERAIIEDDILKRISPVKTKTAQPFSFTSEPFSFAPIPNMNYLRNSDDLRMVKEGQTIVLPIEEINSYVLGEVQKKNLKIVADLPRIVFDEQMDGVLSQMKEIEAHSPLAFMASDPSMVSKYPTIVSTYANITNTLAGKTWQTFGNVVNEVSSIEIGFNKARELGFTPYSGREIELMISENDLLSELGAKENCYLSDPNKNKFFIRRKFGKTIIVAPYVGK